MDDEYIFNCLPNTITEPPDAAINSALVRFVHIQTISTQQSQSQQLQQLTQTHRHRRHKKPEKRRESTSRLKKIWRSPKQSASDSGGESSSRRESKAIAEIQLPTSSSSAPASNKPACSLPLLQIWPSQDSPRGEADGQSFIFSVTCLSIVLCAIQNLTTNPPTPHSVVTSKRHNIH